MLAGALGRVVLGVLLNLWLLYIVLFALVAGFAVFHLFNNWLDVLLPPGPWAA